MNSALNRIREKLKNYPDLKTEIYDDSIIILPRTENEFQVTIEIDEYGKYTVFFESWHDHFDNEEDALNCFAFGLSEDCRLKIIYRGEKPNAWITEFKENGNWKKYSTTSLIRLNFWKKKKVIYKQNKIIKQE